MPRRRSGKKIDFVHWTYAESVVAVAAGTVAENLFIAEHEPQTLLRMRGEIAAWNDGAPTPPRAVRFGAGIILVPEGTASTVLWSPITDADAPWIWVDYGMIGFEEAVADAIDVPMLTGFRKVIDSKSMRILRNQEIQVVFENVTDGGATTVNVGLQVRLLTGK